MSNIHPTGKALHTYVFSSFTSFLLFGTFCNIDIKNMTSVLPNPQDLDAFQLYRGGVVPRNEDGFPSEVRDFVVDSQKWVNDITEPRQRTVRGIVGYRNGVWCCRCFFCEQGPRNCPEVPCVRGFHNARMRPQFRQRVVSEYSTVFHDVQIVKAPWTCSIAIEFRSLLPIGTASDSRFRC